MKANISMTSDINVPARLAQIRSPAFQIFAAQTWHRLYGEFCPQQTGILYNTVKISPYEIEHLAPYAADVYEHNRNYRRDKAPKASSHWDKAAEPTQLDKLIQSMQSYADSGKLGLDK